MLLHASVCCDTPEKTDTTDTENRSVGAKVQKQESDELLSGNKGTEINRLLGVKFLCVKVSW